MTTTTTMRAPKTNPVSADTRQRLIDAAAPLFADKGFQNVTVREICKASNANVAAVNYHFGDKAGLYRAVVTFAIQIMLETNELSQRAGDGLSPEEQLRGFVRVFVSRLTGEGPNAWIHRLMAREMERPTDVLDQVMQQVLKPRIEYLCGVIGAIMRVPPNDPSVMRCVTSLQVQCLVAARPVPKPIAKSLGTGPHDLDTMIDHIVQFSLGGMRAVAAEK
ncbi:MAG: CerR family C-terminal domain-containing protein [Cyanobacteria bacterium]|nr:CerR family C-terminal domain-containing protein [Cyanobacteriota bacterium]